MVLWVDALVGPLDAAVADEIHVSEYALYLAAEHVLRTIGFVGACRRAILVCEQLHREVVFRSEDTEVVDWVVADSSHVDTVFLVFVPAVPERAGLRCSSGRVRRKADDDPPVMAR